MTQQRAGPRDPGSVAFDVLVPNEHRTQLIKMATQSLTQDGFVPLLITGAGLPV